MYEGTANGNFKGEEKQTESARILSRLDTKIDVLDKILASTINKVTSLGGFELTKCDGDTPVLKPVQGGGNFISDLDIRIDRLQRLIDGYDATLRNLDRLA